MTILMQHGGDKKAAVRSAISYADLRNHLMVHCFWGLVLAVWLHLILMAHCHHDDVPLLHAGQGDLAAEDAAAGAAAVDLPPGQAAGQVHAQLPGRSLPLIKRCDAMPQAVSTYLTSQTVCTMLPDVIKMPRAM